MKKMLIGLFGLVAVSTHAAGPQFTRIVMFGDSLSDTGKMYAKMHGYLPSSPPYYQGRFSNGPVWLERLQERFPGLKVVNEAEGGATAVAYNKLGWLNIWAWDPKYQVINNLDYEVTQFLKKDRFNPDDLVIFWVGANDYLAYGWNKEEDARRVRDSIQDAANRVVMQGAKQVLFFNLPDLGSAPSARSQKVVDKVRHVSRYHNQLLLNLTRQLAPTGAVQLFEIDKQFDEMLQNPEQFGLTDTQNPCYDGGYLWKPFSGNTSAPSTITTAQRLAIAGNPLLAQAVASPGSRTASRECGGKMFWDQVHPTTLVHSALAERAGDFIERNYEYLAH